MNGFCDECDWIEVVHVSMFPQYPDLQMCETCYMDYLASVLTAQVHTPVTRVYPRAIWSGPKRGGYLDTMQLSDEMRPSLKFRNLCFTPEEISTQKELLNDLEPDEVFHRAFNSGRQMGKSQMNSDFVEALLTNGA